MRLPVRPLRRRMAASLSGAQRDSFGTILGPSSTRTSHRKGFGRDAAIHVGEPSRSQALDRHPEPRLVIHRQCRPDRFHHRGYRRLRTGSTSVDLIDRLPDWVIHDGRSPLHDRRSHTRAAQRFFFDNMTATCVLAVGNRLVAWPAQSKLVACRLRTDPRLGSARATRPQEVLLLNPAARRLIADDSRGRSPSHECLRTVAGRRPDVVKVANLCAALFHGQRDLVRPDHETKHSPRRG